MSAPTVDRAGPPRSHVSDVVVIVVAAGLGFIASTALGLPLGWPPWLGPIEQVVGLLACGTLWWRREHPVAVASVLVLAGTLLTSVSVAPLFALYAVALLCSLRVTGIFVVANLVSVAGPLLLRPELPTSPALLLALHVIGVVAAAALGLVVRSRRELVQSLRERADAAETEAQLRASQAEHGAREELAREMHDVLGHRLSLLSIQAGALSYNTDTTPAEAARAAEEIRRNARKALQDLREVLDVLRSPQDDTPMPGVTDIPALLREIAASGISTSLSDGDALTSGDVDLPEVTGRTLFRFVQEGLTNVRKHSPGAKAAVTLRGRRGEGIDAEIVNGSASLPVSAVAPGSGLRGLADRAALVGGRIEYGPTESGGWRLAIRLPWPS